LFEEIWFWKRKKEEAFSGFWKKEKGRDVNFLSEFEN